MDDSLASVRFIAIDPIQVKHTRGEVNLSHLGTQFRSIIPTFFTFNFKAILHDWIPLVKTYNWSEVCHIISHSVVHLLLLQLNSVLVFVPCLQIGFFKFCVPLKFTFCCLFPTFVLTWIVIVDVRSLIDAAMYELSFIIITGLQDGLFVPLAAISERAPIWVSVVLKLSAYHWAIIVWDGHLGVVLIVIEQWLQLRQIHLFVTWNNCSFLNLIY